MNSFSFDTYISPMTWRYGSTEMRQLWSETWKRKTLRKIWVALARAESKAGLVTEFQVKEMESKVNDIDIQRSLEWEKEIHHDLMAEIKTFAESCPNAAGIIHLGATSMDILDNMDAIRLKKSIALVRERLVSLLNILCLRIKESKTLYCMAFTHIQSAEPTTLGYRLSQIAQDLLFCLKELDNLDIRGKGFKGAVGTAASYQLLLEGTGLSFESFEKSILEELDLEAFTVTTQVYPRSQDLKIMQVLSLISCILNKAALDFRILQSSSIGELNEPFGKNQVGSSAMPFKRNPINSEKICSLSRLVHSFETNAWDNASLSILERTLDDSANRRIFLPESFLALDECMIVEKRILSSMVVNTDAIKRNFEKFGVFAATEKLLMETVRKGADRQQMHELIRNYSLNAWAEVQKGNSNPLRKDLSKDKTVLSFISEKEAFDLMDASTYCGQAARLSEEVVESVSSYLDSSSLEQ